MGAGKLLGLEEHQKTYPNDRAEEALSNKRPICQTEQGQWKRRHHEGE